MRDVTKYRRQTYRKLICLDQLSESDRNNDYTSFQDGERYSP
jgi:hypothetical protein